MRLYTWNIEVSAAFWGEVHALEIATRNAMHDQMSGRYGRRDWWNDDRIQLHESMADQARKAMQEARRDAERAKRATVPGDTVARLSFGFWTGLLGAGGSLRYETRFWQPFLHRAFPHYRSPSLKPLSKQMNTLRLFRNRLAHHEPIVHRNLHADHSSILMLAGYLDDQIVQYIDSHSRVPQVLKRKYRCLRGLGTSF